MGGAAGCRATRSRSRCASAMRAHNQLQLDIFGEVMDALHQARRGGLGRHEAGWDLERALLRASGKDLARARRGHLGGAQRPRALHLFESDGLGRLRPRHQERGDVQAARADIERWRALRDRSMPMSARAATTPSWAASCAPMAPRSSTPACCCCRRLGFLPPEDPRIRGTVAAIERRLMVDGLVLRYDTAKSDDGLPAGRGRVSGLQLLAGRCLSDARPASTTRRGCSSGCCRCATMSAC